MLNIIKSDLFRIRKGALGFYSIVGLLALGVLTGVMGAKDGAFSSAQQGLAGVAMFLPIFLTNIMMIVWGNEFSYRAVNNTLIFGKSRSQFFFSKVLLTLLLTVAYWLTFILALFGTVYLMKGGFSLEPLLKIMAAQLPFYLTISILGIVLFNIISAPYVSVAVFVTIAFLGDNLATTIIDSYFSSFEKVTQTFFFTNVQSMVQISELSNQFIMTALISAAVYSVLGLVFGYMNFKNRELK